MMLKFLIAFMSAVLQVLRLVVQSRDELIMENLALRQQLSVLNREHLRPRLSWRDRVFWVCLRRVWSKWRNPLLIVKPDTVLRWHRQGFRLYWRWKSNSGTKRGRPLTTSEMRELIGRVARENSTWGAPRIHGELLELGFNISERTVSRYLNKSVPDQDKTQSWLTFLRNHHDAIAAMDLFTVPTVTFSVLYVFFVIHHGRRKLLHWNVTDHPTAEWVIQQLREAFPCDEAPKYLIFDRDKIFALRVVATVRSFGAKPVRNSYRSPWQNGVAERWIGSCRRESLDHVIVLGEQQLRRLLRDYLAYYHEDRCHYGLNKDTPFTRPVQHKPSEKANVVSLPRVGGLHHRYEWRKAA